MGEVALAFVEIGAVLALIVAVAYYRQRWLVSKEIVAVATNSASSEKSRADQVELAKAQADLRSFEGKKGKAKNATIDAAIDAWVDAGRLWPTDKDRDGGEAGAGKGDPVPPGTDAKAP